MYKGNAPTVHIYKEINVGKFATVSHYELCKVDNGSQKLTDFINIQKDRGFAKSNPDYWLKIRKGNKWETLTGLFHDRNHNVFIADKGKNNIKEELILAKFDDDNGQLIVYYFNNYFTKEIGKVIHFINH